MLDPQVAAAIASWQPLEPLDSEDSDVVPTVRDHVTRAALDDADEARMALHAVGRLTLWTRKQLGDTDERTVYATATVDSWLLSDQHPYARNSLRSIRSLVRKIGRAVLVGSPPAATLPLQPFAPPYSADEERWFREAALLAGYRAASARMWAVAGPLGAGLSGVEAAATAVADVCELGGGHLSVTVRGRNNRIVPLRHNYTDLARAALAAADGGPLVVSSNPNNLYRAAERVGRGLSLVRARTTWLLAHVAAGTHPAALRLIAGPVSGRTLALLSEIAASAMTTNEAVRLGMTP